MDVLHGVIKTDKTFEIHHLQKMMNVALAIIGDNYFDILS